MNWKQLFSILKNFVGSETPPSQETSRSDVHPGQDGPRSGVPITNDGERSRILIAGDSHVHAIKDAIAGGNLSETFVGLRLMSEKNGKTIGDAQFSEILEAVSARSSYEVVALTIRGNQYNMMALMRHPQSFDIMIPGFPDLPNDSYEHLIPYSTAYDSMAETLRRGHGKLIKQIVEAASKPVVVLTPPASKEDEQHILKGADTYFKNNGIEGIGVSPAPLRLKLWELQTRALNDFCAELGVPVLPNPPETRDANGYLKPAFYAKDATHANPAYGALVLQQLAEFYETLHGEKLSGFDQAPACR